MLISIIIPALNEEKGIAEVLEHTLKLKGHFEIIVVDGGSQDRTRDIAKTYESVKVYESPKGRAHQMNYGGERANGDVFLFLHADTFLPKEAYKAVVDQCQIHNCIGGSFRLVMDGTHPIYKFYTWLSQFSFEFFTYGDHAMFIKAESFKNIKGFKSISFMEDVEIQKRLRREGKFKKVKLAVTTSNRRFEKNGLARQLAIDFILVFCYKIGISPDRLKRFYPDN